MIETIINTPKVLASNDSALVYDGTSVRTKCAYCSNGGWLDYQDGSPLFKIFGKGYTGYYDINFSASISSATAGTISIALYEDGVIIPDTIRSVTLAAADDYETVSFNKLLRVCPCGTTTFSVRSVPSVVTPTDPTTPIETEIPIVTNATFNIARV